MTRFKAEKIASKQRFVRAGRVAWAELEGTLMLISAEDSTFFQFNETAAFLWRQLERPATAEELSAKLEAAYEVPTVEARHDTGAFLDDLVGRKLLQVCEAGADE